ncbi:MAG: DUF3291 domain-containing protein [Pseudomonadota bacterium]
MKQPAGTHLAELNIAKARDDLDSPCLADFVAALDTVNGIAERSEGFVWRLKDESGNAADIQATDDPRLIVNLSVWETAEHLEHFVWNTVHKQVYNKKAKWFEAPAEAYFVMWWVPEGHQPTEGEAMERLAHLNEHGPSDHAFGWESLPNVQLWKEQRCA